MLSLKELGKSLVEVSVEHLSSSDFAFEHRWFHSDKEIDLYIWKDEKGVILKQQLCFLGLIAEWSLIEGPKTGELDEQESSSNVAGSVIIKYHPEPSVQILEQAVEMSGYIEALNPKDRSLCESNWKRKP